VPLALWAALPAIQVCALRWDQLSIEVLARCSVAAGLSSDSLPAATSPCAAAVLPARGAAPRSEPDPCREHARANGTGCPYAATRDPRPSPAASAHRARSSARAYCLSGLNGGLARYSPPPRLERVATVVAVIPGIEVTDRPVVRRLAFVRVVRARPPTEAWFRLPPSRAPPRCV
jgi:hypothetical protein